MRKVFILLAIFVTNSVLTSCSNPNEELEVELYQQEIFNTGGEDGQTPIEEDDPIDID